MEVPISSFLHVFLLSLSYVKITSSAPVNVHPVIRETNFRTSAEQHAEYNSVYLIFILLVSKKKEKF
jgi:hypothetical protein